MLESTDGQPIKGCFYEAELQKTKSPNVYLVEKVLRSRKINNNIQLFVKWLGFPNQFNSWINKRDIV